MNAVYCVTVPDLSVVYRPLPYDTPYVSYGHVQLMNRISYLYPHTTIRHTSYNTSTARRKDNVHPWKCSQIRTATQSGSRYSTFGRCYEKRYVGNYTIHDNV